VKVPAPFKNLRVKPFHRGRNYSLGLDYPVVYGNLEDAGCWATWNRHTGRVIEIFPHTPNVHGWSNAQHLASLAAQAAAGSSDFNPFELDSVP